VGAADFNRDRLPDIVLQNVTTGVIGVWLMFEVHLMSGLDVPTVPAAGWL
jgi:hypothetical protein